MRVWVLTRNLVRGRVEDDLEQSDILGVFEDQHQASYHAAEWEARHHPRPACASAKYTTADPERDAREEVEMEAFHQLEERLDLMEDYEEWKCISLKRTGEVLSFEFDDDVRYEMRPFVVSPEKVEDPYT